MQIELVGAISESRPVGNRSSLLQLIIGTYNQNFTHPIASGFFVERDKIATNFHVLHGATEISAKRIDTDTTYNLSCYLCPTICQIVP